MPLTREQSQVGLRVKIPTQKKGSSNPLDLVQFKQCLEEAKYTLPYLLISSINPSFNIVGLNFDMAACPWMSSKLFLVTNSFSFEDLDLYEGPPLIPMVNSLNLYPGQLRFVAAACEKLNQLYDETKNVEGNTFLANIEVREDDALLGHIKDEIGGSYSFFPVRQ